MVLINSTVLFLSALKMFQYWKLEKLRNTPPSEPIEIRAEKRTYRVRPEDIIYIEGLGNYITIYLSGDKKLISYSSLKDIHKILPTSFVRTHKSFIVNKDHIISYTDDNVEISGRIIPVSKNTILEF